MEKTYCFKSNRDSAYGLEIRKYMKLLPLWGEVIAKVGGLLGNPITAIAHEVDELWIDVDQVSPEIAKLFTRDGKLKKNSKAANDIRKKYLQIIEDVGLEGFMDKPRINFIYGVMRTSQQQSLASFISSEHDVYFKANYDMLDREKSNGYIEPITQIQFEEKHLEGLKKNDEF
ncbi:hypothetical protein H7992_04880 [Sporosarcina sp. resist]|uniref:hypothetical protein n=1 Tax=Sporosarcina sp. resist TaxID=2762563 RepID=UPI00164DCF2A|nr:hypothetical protein [Sporosarcina sp. resist]QNK89062.1 hypothetical protein H7992_04880 [Sporosarcina sp. resist]